LPDNDGHQPQKHRLCFKQVPKSARAHVDREPVVKRCSIGGSRFRCIGGFGRIASLDELLVDRRGGQIGQFLQQGTGKAGVSGFGQIIDCAPIHARPQEIGSPVHHRHQQILERTRTGASWPMARRGACAWTLQRRLYPHGVD
jgi:hypothetical protein